MFKFLMFTAALVSVVPTLGCQPRVVFLSFDAADVGGDVDHLWVEGIMPVKTRKELSGLQVIGYYGVSPSAQQITVRVTACWGGDLLADYQRGQDVVGDDVTIKIQPFIDTNLSRPPPCPMGLGRMGTGGASGGAGGNGAGGAGGDTEGGAGGSAAGGAGGTDIGGASGADGGVTDSAECGTDTHAPTCDPPSGDPGVGDIPDAGTISPDCIQYCGDMRTKCGAVYDSDDSCQRYCAAAGWAPTGISANSLECRTMYLSTAEPTNSNCSNASPGGGASRCGFPCPNFCAAWISICHPDASEASACVTACQTQASATAGADPACRFQWLQRALYDKRYCDYVKYGSCLSCD